MDFYHGTAISGMRSIKRDNLLYNTTHPNYKFYQEKFPQYWKEAEVLSKHGLL